MNFKYLIFICLMFIVSIGAVSAADDVNNTVDNAVDADTAINRVSIDSVIMDSPIYANNAKEYTITNDNYENYFDNETGDILDTAPFNNGDVLKIDNVSDKCFVISKNLTILPAGANTTFTNVGFNFIPGSEGSIVNGVTINNNVGKWSNNDGIFLIPILIQHTKNITVINSNLYSSAGTVAAPNNVVYMVNSSYCNIRNNTISQSSGKVPMNIVTSSYNNITDNKIYSKAANVIFVGLGFSTLSVTGISEGNLFKNNILDGNGISSAMCYAIKLQGNSNVGKTIGQNTFIGNTISNAYDGIYIQDDVNGTTIINNTFINVRTGIEMAHQRAVVEKAYIYGNNITATTDAIVITRGSATIEDNVINVGNRGIFLKPFSTDLLILNNTIIARGQYAVWSDSRSNNVTVMGNYLVSSSFKGDNSVKAKDKSKVSGNGPLDINVAIDADITKNATATIKLSPMVNGTITINFNGKIETIDFNGSGSLVYDLGLLEFGEHNITVTYNGNNNFNGTTVTKTFFVDKINTGIKLVVGNINVDETAVINVTLTPGINGTVKVVVNGQTYNVAIKNGIGTLEVKWLKAGKYDVSAYFTGQNYYKDSFASASFSVNKLNPVLSINASSIKCGEDVIINVSSSVSSIEVELIIYLDGSKGIRYESFYIYGQRSIKISDLPAGSYLVQFIAPEDTKNNQAQTTVRFTVSKLASSVAVDVKDIVVGDDAVIGVSVPDIVSGVVNVTVNGRSYDVAIVDGKGTLTISNLVAGNYNVNVKYGGDDKYLPSSNSTNFTVSKVSSSVIVSVDDIVVGDDAVIGVSVPDIVSGVVNVTVNGRSYNVAIVDGKGVLTISNLVAGGYDVNVNYAGDNKYLASSNSTKFTISKLPSSVIVDVKDIVVGEDAIVSVILPDGATGSVTITVDGKNYVAIVKYGVTSVAISDLAKGKYNVSVKYSGDNKYLTSENTTQFSVAKVSDYNVTVGIGDIIEGENASVIVVVPDDGTGEVIITINGKEYKGSVDNGVAKVIIPDLKEGTYKVVTFYTGDNKYDSMIVNGTITVNKNTGTTLIMEELVKYVGGSQRLSAKLVDAYGNPIANATIYFTVNGITYARITDINGTASMAINLVAGTYNASAVFNGTAAQDKATANTNVIVKSTIVGKDTTLYFRNGTKYEAKFLDTNGKALTNTNVTFNINGVFYQRMTDSNGVARLNINLLPDTYIITAYNPVNKEQTSNKVTVLPTLETKDLSMKFQDGSKFTAKVLDGQGKVLANQNVTFNVNGVFYNRISDANGVASLNINLIAGKYIITSMWNGYQVGNNITIA